MTVTLRDSLTESRKQVVSAFKDYEKTVIAAGTGGRARDLLTVHFLIAKILNAYDDAILHESFFMEQGCKTKIGETISGDHYKITPEDIEKVRNYD